MTVEFVGVWWEYLPAFFNPTTYLTFGNRDTVSSVGIIPRTHPYTSVNYAVKHFRHALALDERRARFRPNVWNEPTIEREQDLDVDEPDMDAAGLRHWQWATSVSISLLILVSPNDSFAVPIC